VCRCVCMYVCISVCMCVCARAAAACQQSAGVLITILKSKVDSDFLW